MSEHLQSLLDERPYRVTAVLIPGRHQLDHCDDMPEWVVDRDSIGPGRIDVFVGGFAHEPGLGWSLGHGDPAL